MTSESTLVSRRERAELSRSDRERVRFWRGKFGVFLDELFRLKLEVIYPTQLQVARLLAELTFGQGDDSVAFGSLNELICYDERVAGFAGLHKSDLSLAINGGVKSVGGVPRRVLGLVDYGICRVEVKQQLEAGVPPVSVLQMVADSRQWTVPVAGWRYVEAERSAWVMHSLACRQRHTAALPSLAVEPDLQDARAAVGESPVRPMDDALVVRRAAESGAGASRRSVVRNADLPAKARCVPQVGTHRARASENGKQRTETVQPLNCSGNARRTNGLLADLKVEFVHAHGEAHAAAEMQRSGIFWRKVANNFPNELEREIGALRGFILEGGKFERAAWFWLQFYLLQTIAVPSWEAAWEKNSRNLLINQ